MGDLRPAKRLGVTIKDREPQRLVSEAIDANVD